MTVKIYILFLLFLSAFFTGCSVEDSEMDMSLTPDEKKTQVVLTLSIPAVSIPQSTRIVTPDNEDKIDELTIWVFDTDDNFLYQVNSKESGNDGTKKVIIRQNKIYATLLESDIPVKLAMIANTSVAEPEKGANKTTLLNSLTFDYLPGKSEYIPMYGETKTPFIVKEGATPEDVSLKRALARIEVDASNILSRFKLESAKVVNINTKGTVVQSNIITNSQNRTSYETNAIGNKWTFYIPEATDVDSEDSNVRTSIILKGKYKDNNTKYYRLDFIKRTQDGTSEIKYESIKTIDRNHRYVFHIENMVSGAGYDNEDEALAKQADNAIIANAGIMIIEDENIRDITTDNQYYLGITSENVKATIKPGSSRDYYTVKIDVVTNHPDGWALEIEELPDGVEVSTNKWSTDIDTEREKTVSVWVYIKASSVRPGDDIRTLYIYSGNIRKKIEIKIE